MFKKAEAYIDTVITVFLGIIILYVSMNLFSYFVQYQKLSNVADNALRYATITGDLSSVELNSKIEQYLDDVGFNPEKVTISWDGSDFIGVDGKNDKVQYGDKIQLTLITKHNMAFIGESGGLSFDIACTRINSSEIYDKTLNNNTAIHESEIEGDVNGDGYLNDVDLAILTEYVNTGTGNVSIDAADMNNDNIIDISDVNVLSTLLGFY